MGRLMIPKKGPYIPIPRNKFRIGSEVIEEQGHLFGKDIPLDVSGIPLPYKNEKMRMLG